MCAARSSRVQVATYVRVRSTVQVATYVRVRSTVQVATYVRVRSRVQIATYVRVRSRVQVATYVRVRSVFFLQLRHVGWLTPVSDETGRRGGVEETLRDSEKKHWTGQTHHLLYLGETQTSLARALKNIWRRAR